MVRHRRDGRGNAVASAGPREAPRRLPRRFWHLFWNEEPASLECVRDGDLLAVRMLLGDDLEALAWACSNLPAASLRRAAANRGADARVRSLVVNVLAATQVG